jgi:hypothetical protein
LASWQHWPARFKKPGFVIDTEYVRYIASIPRLGLQWRCMSKKPRKKKKHERRQPQAGGTTKNTRYGVGEIALAVLGAALLIMVAGIVITTLLG